MVLGDFLNFFTVSRKKLLSHSRCVFGISVVWVRNSQIVFSLSLISNNMTRNGINLLYDGPQHYFLVFIFFFAFVSFFSRIFLSTAKNKSKKLRAPLVVASQKAAKGSGVSDHPLPHFNSFLNVRTSATKIHVRVRMPK